MFRLISFYECLFSAAVANHTPSLQTGQVHLRCV